MDAAFNIIHLCRWAQILGNWGNSSGYDAMMSQFRLLSTTNCIPISHYIYIKCLSTLRCCGYAHGCSLTLIHLASLGPDYLGNWVRLSENDAMMSWLRLLMLSTLVCISLSHYIYKVFEHLKMLWLSSRVQPYTDTPMTIYSDFGKNWVRLSENDAMMSWLRLFSTPDCIPLSHYIYIKCLSTLRCCD